MCVVSQTEFNSNPAKYFDIAQHETVLIRAENQTFELVKKKLITDEDLASGISGDELKKRMHLRIDKIFDAKK